MHGNGTTSETESVPAEDAENAENRLITTSRRCRSWQRWSSPLEVRAARPSAESSRAVPETQKPDRSNDHPVPTCSEPDCDEEAAVVVYVPWAEDRPVCAAHGRVIVQKDGVVAEPIEDAAEWGS